jgi:hypothetical protein
VLGEQYPDSSGEAAEFGTQVHSVAEEVLRLVKEDPREPENYTDLIETLLPEEYHGRIGECEGHIRNYVKYFLSLYRGKKSYFDVMIEEKLEIYRLVFGTVDLLAFNRREKKLYVVDLKTGRNLVPAIDNLQLSLYALGAYKILGSDIEKVVLVIAQNTDFESPVKEWVIDDPKTHFDGLLKRIVTAVTKTEEYSKDYKSLEFIGDDAFNQGSWCKYCKALAGCPKHYDKFTEVLNNKSSMDLSPEKVSKILEEEKDLLRYFKAVKEYAKNLFEFGEGVPGFELKQSWSNRSWADESEFVDFVSGNFSECLDKVFTKKTLKSPAQVEKIIPVEELQKFTTRRPRGMMLVKNRSKV